MKIFFAFICIDCIYTIFLEFSFQSILEPNLAKRAEHYFSENERVMKGIILYRPLLLLIFMISFRDSPFITHVWSVLGIEAWASGNLREFGELITASGLSSIQNYECGKC